MMGLTVRPGFTWRDVVAAVVVPLILVVGIAIPVFDAARTNEGTLIVVCENLKSTNKTLTALKAVSNELGIPGEFTIPEVPEECGPLLP